MTGLSIPWCWRSTICAVFLCCDNYHPSFPALGFSAAHRDGRHGRTMPTCEVLSTKEASPCKLPKSWYFSRCDQFTVEEDTRQRKTRKIFGNIQTADYRRPGKEKEQKRKKKINREKRSDLEKKARKKIIFKQTRMKWNHKTQQTSESQSELEARD